MTYWGLYTEVYVQFDDSIYKQSGRKFQVLLDPLKVPGDFVESGVIFQL